MKPMTLLQLWRQYTSQELLGETLREAAPDLFDELNTAIEKLDEREPIVQEVIAKWNAYAAAQSGDAVGIAHLRADALLAARKLADWKP